MAKDSTEGVREHWVVVEAVKRTAQNRVRWKVCSGGPMLRSERRGLSQVKLVRAVCSFIQVLIYMNQTL